MARRSFDRLVTKIKIKFSEVLRRQFLRFCSAFFALIGKSQTRSQTINGINQLGKKGSENHKNFDHIGFLISSKFQNAVYQSAESMRKRVKSSDFINIFAPVVYASSNDKKIIAFHY